MWISVRWMPIPFLVVTSDVAKGGRLLRDYGE